MDAKFLLYEAPENILKNMLTVNTALNIFKCAERKSNSNDVLFTTKTQEVKTVFMWVVLVVWAARITCAQEFKVSLRNKARSHLNVGGGEGEE